MPLQSIWIDNMGKTVKKNPEQLKRSIRGRNWIAMHAITRSGAGSHKKADEKRMKDKFRREMDERLYESN